MESDDLATVRVGVAAALREGDSALAFQLVSRLLAEGVSMAEVVDKVLAPIQTSVGDRWEVGDVSISEEHVGTATLDALMSLIAGAFDQPPESDLVVVVTAEGDRHSLPGRMATALLAYEGYRTRFLGSSVPAADLADYLTTVQADALVVSCARPAGLLGARDCVAAGHAAGLPVLVGGRAFGSDDSRWRAIGADARAEGLPDVVRILESWSPDPAEAERSARPVDPVVAVLAARPVAVAVRLAEVLARHSPDGVTEQAQTALEELVLTSAVARHLHDPDLLHTYTDWLSRLLAAHHGLSVTPDGLRAALETVEPTAG